MKYAEIYTRKTILRFFAAGWNRKLKRRGAWDQKLLRRSREADQRYYEEVWK